MCHYIHYGYLVRFARAFIADMFVCMSVVTYVVRVRVLEHLHARIATMLQNRKIRLLGARIHASDL